MEFTKEEEMRHDISVQEFIQHAKHICLTKEEAYKWIEEHKASIEDENKSYVPLYPIKLTSNVQMSETEFEKVRTSWGDEW